jgi:hypothetical protein
MIIIFLESFLQVQFPHAMALANLAFPGKHFFPRSVGQIIRCRGQQGNLLTQTQRQDDEITWLSVHQEHVLRRIFQSYLLKATWPNIKLSTRVTVDQVKGLVEKI